MMSAAFIPIIDSNSKCSCNQVWASLKTLFSLIICNNVTIKISTLEAQRNIVHFIHFIHCSSITCKLQNWERYRKLLFRQSLKHVSVFKNSNFQFPYYCLQETNWILNKCHTWITKNLIYVTARFLWKVK